MTEESTQFSLEELLKIEDQRVEEQKRDREREARDRVAAIETEAREAANAKARAHRIELDDLARREATQKAIVEQARLEVEVRARAEERERERRHELEIERLRQQAPPPPRRHAFAPLVGATLFGGLAMLAVAVGVHFGVTAPNAQRRQTELEGKVEAADGRAGDLARRVEEGRRAISERDQRIAELHQLDPPCGKATPPGKKPSSPAPTHAPKSATEPTCDVHDPMCFAVPHGRP